MHRIGIIVAVIGVFIVSLMAHAIAEDKKPGSGNAVINQPKGVTPQIQQVPPKTTTTPPKFPTTGGNTVASKPYSCNTKGCACKGDDNCNKMFSSGACTGGMLSTNCNTVDNKPVECTCVNKD